MTAIHKDLSSSEPLSVPPLDEVRWAFIGLGSRGSGHVQHIQHLDGTIVTAICDTHEANVRQTAAWVHEQTGRTPYTAYDGGNREAWRTILDRDDVDAVVISTGWDQHAPMAAAAMRAGKHAFVEIPAALTIEECWELVETSEATGRHCMMLENCNYGREELMLLNMCAQGLFGEILHGEAAYIHELRTQMFEDEHGTGSWRTYQYATNQGNLYPTHGVGPIAHCMGVNRGDTFDYLVSMSSPARGRQLFARENFPADHKWNAITEWKCGDVSTSLIKLVSGKTLMVQWDETSPRPYSRHNYLQGTRGAFGSFPNRIALDYPLEALPETLRGSVTEVNNRTNFHEWETDMEPWFQTYEHPLWKKIGDEAVEQGGHGGMDYVMFWRIQQCLRQGKPMDQSVYDAALWSAIAPLSRASVEQGAAPQKFPDFTRGQWQTAQPLTIEA